MFSTIELPVEAVAQHRWLLRPQIETPVESLRAFTDAFRGFAALGSAGAFVSTEGAAVMQIREQQRLDDHWLSLVVDVTHCDPRYSRVLRNIVYGIGESLESPALEFRIDSAVPRSNIRRFDAEVDEALVADGHFYPGLPPWLGVQVRVEEPPNYASGRRILLRCEDALPTPVVNGLTSLVDLWASVMSVGFPSSEQELVEGQTFILNVTGCQHDDVTYEVLIEEFVAAEAAFLSLVNLLAVGLRHQVRMREVVIE